MAFGAQKVLQTAQPSPVLQAAKKSLAIAVLDAMSGSLCVFSCSFSTSATLRPSRCLLLRLASDPMLLTGRSRACGMVGFAIPRPEGSNPEGKGLEAGPTARLLTSADAGRHGGAVWESGERREAGVP